MENDIVERNVSAHIRSIIQITGILLFMGCHDERPEPGEWRGHAAIADDHILPITAYLDLLSDPPSGYFLVGGEQTEIPEIVYTGDSLRLIFGEYGAEMSGNLSDESYTGSYYRFREDTTSFPFILMREPDWSVSSLNAASIQGTYRVQFRYPDRIDSSSVAVVEVVGESVHGTIIHPSGDYGLLEGTFDGSRLQFSRFTGWQAIYIDLQTNGEGLEGSLYVRADAPIPIALRPTDPSAVDHGAITRMRDPNAPFKFAGLTIAGDSVTSDDVRFQGNPIVIDIMGTWCHNCLDAAPLLEKAYAEHADQGLQVVSLAFENFDDYQMAKKNIGLFVNRFETSFPVLFCGDLSEENVDARLRSQLDDFFSYPTTLFIDRSGKVVDIQTGFNGPGAGEERWQAQVREFEEAVGRITAGSAGSAD